VKKSAIIVAGGMGLRMQSTTPKQFLLLRNKPVLLHSMESFHTLFPDCKIIVVLPPQYWDTWRNLFSQSGSDTPHIIESGGPTRFHSVKNGLVHTTPEEYIAIHDAARPLTSANLIVRAYEKAATAGSAIPVIQPPESIRMVTANGSAPVDRSLYRMVQTPQVFRGDWLHQAYELPYHESFTDDATVVEKSGFPLTLIDGDPFNIKITRNHDLELAACLLERWSGPAPD
jgi:2-C-methyl-D-erythritol 4-phosphate cytidylyltransferase